MIIYANDSPVKTWALFQQITMQNTTSITLTHMQCLDSEAPPDSDSGILKRSEINDTDIEQTIVAIPYKPRLI